MRLYSAIDLHSNNHFLTIIDDEDHRVFERRLPNDLANTLKVLEPYRRELTAIAVESTFNWYWLVDGLMEAGYEVVLVNPSKVRQYEGLKHTDDRHDAFWLAHTMRLGILPACYIYPKAERSLRDLLRERRRLVQQRTTHTLSVQSTIWRHTSVKLSTEAVRGEKEETWPTIADPRVKMGLEAHKAAIATLTKHIDEIEKTVLKQMKPRMEYKCLLTVTGIGPVLGWTILLETGDLRRFASVGNYASYARSVDSKKMSNGKKKGEANEKNGNPYLSWAYFEAAHHAIVHLPAAKRFYERKAAQRNKILAVKAIAHKICRASFYVMRDRTLFDPERLFA